MVFKPISPKRQAAFTLIEMMIGGGLALVLLLGATSFYLFTLRSFAAMANYTDLNRQSRNTSDVVSRDIRGASGIRSGASSNEIVLTGINVTYTYDPVGRTLTRDGAVLLQQIDSFAFQFYLRPTNGSPFDVFVPTTPDNAKLAAFRWTCSRQVSSAPADTESVQLAKIDLRNQ